MPPMTTPMLMAMSSSTTGLMPGTSVAMKPVDQATTATCEPTERSRLRVRTTSSWPTATTATMGNSVVMRLKVRPVR